MQELYLMHGHNISKFKRKHLFLVHQIHACNNTYKPSCRERFIDYRVQRSTNYGQAVIIKDVVNQTVTMSILCCSSLQITKKILSHSRKSIYMFIDA
jgi:hypothetical protein